MKSATAETVAVDSNQKTANRELVAPLIQAGMLGGLAMVLTSLLAGTKSLTAEELVAREREDREATLFEVLPPESRLNDVVSDTVSAGKDNTIFHLGKNHEHVTAVAFATSTNGYGGPIQLMLGVSRDGKLLGVRVISHSETPGLGDKIEAKKSDWIRSFDGKSLTDPGPEGWAVEKDGGVFDAFSGATITPRAVVNGVHAGLTMTNSVHEQLFSEPIQEASQGSPP